MRASVIWWIVAGLVALELLSFMTETELRLADLERLALKGKDDDTE